MHIHVFYFKKELYGKIIRKKLFSKQSYNINKIKHS